MKNCVNQETGRKENNHYLQKGNWIIHVEMNINEMSCSQKDGCLILDHPGAYFEIMETVESDGYYETEITYYHEVWDKLLSIEVKHADGTKTSHRKSLPSGQKKRMIPIYMKAGRNKLLISNPSKDPEYKVGIYDISIRSKYLVLPEISPCYDVYDLLRPKKLNVVVKSYSSELVCVKAATKEIGFAIKEIKKSDWCKDEGLLKTMKRVYFDEEDIRSLSVGRHKLIFHFSDLSELEYTLEIKEEVKASFQIINFDVSCANCTLLRLPNGRNLLIDSATQYQYDNVVDKYLKKNQIKIDYYLLTHFHDDHNGRLEEILETNNIDKPDFEKEIIVQDKFSRENYLNQFSYLDSTMLCFYDEIHNIWDLGGVTMTVLNSRYDENGNPSEVYNYPYIKYNEHNYENSTSISLLIKYKGFGYYHGADNYAFAQTRLMEDYRRIKNEETLCCDYYFGNHHFICDISPEFIKTVNPVAVFVPNGQTLYPYSTYNFDYVERVQNCDFYNKRLRDTLISGEVGTVIVSVEDKDNWWYESVLNENFV